MIAELDLLQIASWTNLGYAPIQARDIEHVAESIHIHDPMLTTVYAVVESTTAKAVRYAFGARVAGPIRFIQFEGIAVVLVVSGCVPVGEIRFYADVFDEQPKSVIAHFTINRFDYPIL